MKKVLIFLAIMTTCICHTFSQFTKDDILYWIGSGTDSTAFVISWCDPGGSNQTVLVWGFIHNGSVSGYLPKIQIAAAEDPRLFYATSSGGSALGGLGFDVNGNGNFALVNPDDPTDIIYPDASGKFPESIIDNGYTPLDPDDLWMSGWGTGFWQIGGINNWTSYRFNNFMNGWSCPLEEGDLVAVNPPVSKYTITPSASTGGIISPDDEIVVPEGISVTFTFTSDQGYELDSLFVDNIYVPDSIKTYTFINVTGDHTIYAQFKEELIPTYIISVIAPIGGIISPNEDVSVNQGDNIQFSFQPNTYYAFDSLFVDDVYIPDSTSSYTFVNVMTQHKIQAIFKRTYELFDGPVGTDGCKAIENTDSRIISWATGCQIIRGYQDIAFPENGFANFGIIQNALGEASSNAIEAVSLGDGGVVILTFDRPIKNGAGTDFAVFENSFSDSFLELAFVEVSSDGINYVRFPATSYTQTETQIDGNGTIEAHNINNLAGKYRGGWGTPFDLEELKDSTAIDINNIRFVKIVDVIGTINPAYASYDTYGNIINDPYPTEFASGGFDLTGVAIINGGNPYLMSSINHFLTQENTILAPDETGIADESGLLVTSLNTSIFAFKGSYSTEYGGYYNDGFVISNRQNNTIQNYDHSAITIGGMNGAGTSYLAAYYAGYGTNYCTIEFNNNKKHLVQGMYVTNSTTSFLSMKNGDNMAKKFGGNDGTDEDWFILTAIGYDGKEETTRKDFYLADYRFDNSEDDYIVNDWRWFDLVELGEVTHIEFIMSSSDAPGSSMMTPAYFCVDQITVVGNGITKVKDIPVNKNNLRAYPNPCKEQLTIENLNNNGIITIYSLTGQQLIQQNITGTQQDINVENLPTGMYVLVTKTKEGSQSIKFTKEQ